MYDLIGDIHGHVAPLEQLLNQLGYQKVDGVYQHPSRKAIFLGDFVDRGPAIRETLALVRPMIEKGHALAVMGNHEYNAICYQTPMKENEQEFLRPHTKDNTEQYEKTLQAFQNNRDELNDYIDWFKTLPLYLELEHPLTGNRIRVIHACWSETHIEKIRNVSSVSSHGEMLQMGLLGDDFLHLSAQKEHAEYEVIETLLKGPEAKMPGGKSYSDLHKKTRDKFRLKWWQAIQPGSSLEDISLSIPDNFTDKFNALTESEFQEIQQATACFHYPKSAPPVFFGHYWIKDTAQAFGPNICCLDYSIADHEAHPEQRRLAAYRWEGEAQLSLEHLIFVPLNGEDSGSIGVYSCTSAS